MKIMKLLTRISVLVIASISLFPTLQANASEGEFKDLWISVSSSEVADKGGIQFADGGRIDWCMPDELARQAQSFSLTRFRGESPTVGQRPGCSRPARFMIADAFCKMRGFQQAEVFHIIPLNYIYRTNNGRQVRDGSGRVMYTPRIAEGRNGQITIPGWTQINNRSNGKFDYIPCTRGSQLTSEMSNQTQSIVLAQGTSSIVPQQRFEISQLPDLSRPIEKKTRLPGGTVLAGFRYNPSTKEVGILLSGDHVIKPVIEKQGELRPKYTNYNRVTIKNFKYRGINVGQREVLVDGRIRYQKLEKKPWLLSGRYTTFDQAAEITLGINFEVKNRQLDTGTYIRRFNPDWASGLLGFIYSVFDAAFGVISWVSEGEFIRISDMLGTVAASYVNLAQPQQQLVNSMFQEVNDWNSKNLVYLNRVDYDPDGIWMLFKADQNQADRLWSRLGNMVGSYFPGLTVDNQLNLMEASVQPPPPPLACPTNFSPTPFQGRTGKVAFYNEWNMPVTVILYHPNSSSIYNRYTVPPGLNQILGNNIIVGDDWGVCFENKPSTSGLVNNLGTISDYDPNYPGGSLFMIQNGRIK